MGIGIIHLTLWVTGGGGGGRDLICINWSFDQFMQIYGLFILFYDHFMIIYLRKELVHSTSGSAFSAVWWRQLLHVPLKRRSSTHQVQRENMCSMERNTLGIELRKGKD